MFNYQRQQWPALRQQQRRRHILSFTLAILLTGTWIRSLLYLVELHNLDVMAMTNNADINDVNMRENSRGSSTTRISTTANNNNSNKSHHPNANDKDSTKLSSKNVHIVFSTDCSGYQHWQSIVLYYSLRRSGHLGPVTRVASGCKNGNEEESIRNEL